MEQRQLLTKAYEDFTKKFTQTPEQAGYKEMNIYKN